MSSGSRALRALEREVAAHLDETITPDTLLRMIREAAQWTEDLDHDDYMGEDQ